jgi:hypothetical protein
MKTYEQLFAELIIELIDNRIRAILQERDERQETLTRLSRVQVLIGSNVMPAERQRLIQMRNTLEQELENCK